MPIVAGVAELRREIGPRKPPIFKFLALNGMEKWKKFPGEVKTWPHPNEVSNKVKKGGPNFGNGLKICVL